MKKTVLRGFTLAETLITLGIIGIIAALTIPTVISNYQKKTYVAGLQRVYNQLANAGVSELADNKVDSLVDAGFDDVNKLGDFLKKYFKVTQDCGVSQKNSTACMGKSYKVFKSASAYEPDVEGRYCVMTDTGVSICMSAMKLDDYENSNHGYSDVIVDINGKKAPNKLGRDLFGFEFYSDGKVSEGYDQNTHVHYCTEDYDDKGYAAGCFSRIMNDGWKMDY